MDFKKRKHMCKDLLLKMELIDFSKEVMDF